jgi:hypothetical protein
MLAMSVNRPFGGRMMRLFFAFCCTLALAGPASAQAPRLARARLAAAPDARLRPFHAPRPAARAGAFAHANAAADVSSAAALDAAPDGRRASVPALVASGILGGGVGLFGGAFLGAWGGNLKCRDATNPDACDTPVILGAIIGGIAGEALLLPVAEHLVGGRRGPFGAEVLASVGLAGLGLGLLSLTDFDKPAAPVILVSIPLAQLSAVTALERR